jgi:hypothetical protein
MWGWKPHEPSCTMLQVEKDGHESLPDTNLSPTNSVFCSAIKTHTYVVLVWKHLHSGDRCDCRLRPPIWRPILSDPFGDKLSHAITQGWLAEPWPHQA